VARSQHGIQVAHCKEREEPVSSVDGRKREGRLEFLHSTAGRITGEGIGREEQDTASLQEGKNRRGWLVEKQHSSLALPNGTRKISSGGKGAL